MAPRAAGEEPDDRNQGEAAFAPTETRAGAGPGLPGRIGDCRIVRRLGAGGMGVVYEAEQQHPKRAVALKVVRGGSYVDEHVLRLFRREAQTLARLRHPGIAAIYESGCTEGGEHFFAMELVRGETLGDYVRRRQSGERLAEDELRHRLALFRRICEAVSYAHQRGVIHRDLKPSNILVARPEAAAPAADAEPVTPEIKILDFGIARLTDADVAPTVVTEVGRVQGTLAYVSPEQVRGNPDEIDLRSDVYSLGVILHELVTGELPYDVQHLPLPAAMRVIGEESPRLESRTWSHARRLDPDVATIVLKALEKEPARRYQGAAALADDVARYLADQPILAHPPSTGYQIRKLVARHKAPFGFAAALVVLLAGFAASMTVQADRVARERDRASLEAETARQVSDFLAGLFEVSDPDQARGNTITAREILDRGAARIARELHDQPLVEARLMDAIGNVYRSLGLYGEAEPLLTSALRARESALGPEHADVAQSLVSLGRLDYSRGRFSESESSYRRALAIREQVLGPEPVDVGWSCYWLGSVVAHQGDFEGAKLILERALAIFERQLGPEHPAVAACLNDLAANVMFAGREDDVISILARALRIRERGLGPDHPEVADALNNLGYALTLRGEYARARPLLERGVAIYERVLGPAHSTTAVGLHSLGELFRRMHEDARAKPLLERAIAIQESTQSPDHPDLALSLRSRGLVLLDLGKVAQAEADLRRALAMQERALGPEDPAVAESLEACAALLRRTGRPADADSLEARARAIRGRGAPGAVGRVRGRVSQAAPDAGSRHG